MKTLRIFTTLPLKGIPEESPMDHVNFACLVRHEVHDLLPNVEDYTTKGGMDIAKVIKLCEQNGIEVDFKKITQHDVEEMLSFHENGLHLGFINLFNSRFVVRDVVLDDVGCFIDKFIISSDYSSPATLVDARSVLPAYDCDPSSPARKSELASIMVQNGQTFSFKTVNKHGVFILEDGSEIEI